MARAGLYKTEVQKARDSLIAQGKHPSVDAVRVALGNTGSKSTIHRYLKELDAENGTTLTAEIVISDSLRSLVGQLSKRLVEEADTRVADIQARCDAALQKAAEALAHQEREGRALSDRLRQTETALHETTRSYQDALGQLHERSTWVRALEERVAGLDARLVEQVSHVQSLEQKHQQARETLEHFRQAAKEQRDAEARRHEHQVQQLQVELRQANELVTAKNYEVMQLNRDNARLTELHGQSENALRLLRREHEQLSHVSKEIAALKRENDTLGQQRVQVTYERDQLRAELDRCIADLAAERQARLAELEERRRDDARFHAIEERLAHLTPHATTETAP